jgi:arginyl-tRNA synthetase
VTYTGKDVAYHLWKFNLLGKDFLYQIWKEAPQQGPLGTTDQAGKKSDDYGHADYVYNVIDVRQAYPQAMVKIALESLGHLRQAENLKHVSYGIVSLSEGAAKALGIATEEGKSIYSMSGRKGIGIKVDDLLTLIEERVTKRSYNVESNRSEQAIAPRKVAVGAIKYYMLRYNPQTDMVFDFDEALSLEGNTGPYIQYAHARMAGILDKAGKVSKYELKNISLSPEEDRLVKKVYEWPQVLDRTATDLNVNALTTYAFELANAFNSFYESNPVMKAEGNLKEQRIALVAACKDILADVLTVLGIEAPEKM